MCLHVHVLPNSFARHTYLQQEYSGQTSLVLPQYCLMILMNHWENNVILEGQRLYLKGLNISIELWVTKDSSKVRQIKIWSEYNNLEVPYKLKF